MSAGQPGLRPFGSLARPGEPVHVTPAEAGWSFAGLRVLSLAPGELREVDLAGVEAAVLPLAAQDVDVVIDGVSLRLAGRRGVFDAVTDWAYAPPGSRLRLGAAGGGEVALATAPAEQPNPAQYVPAADVPVEVRGAGPATRQITLFCAPDTFPGAQRLVACEVLTPDGNWSSYPPHRHDGIGDCPYSNEEIYYFRIGTTGSRHGEPAGFGLHRTYTTDEDPGPPVDIDVAVRDGDVFLIPRGYHGPCVAAPGYPMYYLNVLGGPGPRTFGFCDDPAHHWVRESWADQAPDPRVPLTTARGGTP